MDILLKLLEDSYTSKHYIHMNRASTKFIKGRVLFHWPNPVRPYLAVLSPVAGEKEWPDWSDRSKK